MGMFNKGIDAANDLVSRSISVITTKKEMVLKQAINTALLFVILLVFGCLDFATLEFHGELLLTPSYWGEIITKTTAGVCAFNIGINLLYDSEIKKDEILKNHISRYNELVKKVQLDFEYFVNKVYNRKNKIEAYKSQITKRIYWLNRVSKDRDRLLYSSTLVENQEKKLKNRYCIKRKQLEELKSDEFIEKNFESLKVKYLAVDPAVFQLEIDGSTTIKGVKTKGSITGGRIKESAGMVMGMVLFSAFTASFGLALDKQEFENNMIAFWHYCLKTVEDLGIVLWQAFRGMLRCRKLVSSQLTQPYAGRVAVLEEYLNWRLQNKIPDNEIYKEFPKDDTMEIELTEEQYEELKKGA